MSKLPTLENVFMKFIAPAMFVKTEFFGALIGLAVTLWSANEQAEVRKEQRKEQKKQRKINQNMEAVKAAESRKAAVRERRNRAAAMENQAVQAGVQSGSAYAGSQSSLGSQLGSNIAMQNTTTSTNAALGTSRQAEQDAANRGQDADGIKNIVDQGLGYADDMDIFG